MKEMEGPTNKREKVSVIYQPTFADETDNQNAENDGEISQKKFMEISTTEFVSSTRGHLHKIRDCMRFKSSDPDNLLKPEDQITEIQGKSTSSLTHETLIENFNDHVYKLYDQKKKIDIKVKRKTDGVTEIVTFSIKLDSCHIEEDGSDICTSIIARLSCITVQYEYGRKILRTVRLGTPQEKFLKQHKRKSEHALLVEPIDNPRSDKYNFECVEYEVGPLGDSRYRYLCCFRVKSEDSCLYIRQNKGDGLTLSEMGEIKESNDNVTCDPRFCFREEYQGDNFFRKRLDNDTFLAYNAVKGLHFKPTIKLPWSTEAMEKGQSDEFRFRMITIDSDPEN